MVTLCSTSLTLKILRSAPYSVFICCVWIWKQTAIISLYSINWLVCIAKTECVYCAVRAEFLYTIQVTLMAECPLRSPANPCEICGGHSGTGTGFSPSTSVFPFPSALLHTRRHLYVLTRRSNGRNLGTFQKAIPFRRNKEHRLKKYFYLVLNGLRTIYLISDLLLSVHKYTERGLWDFTLRSHVGVKTQKLRTDKLQMLNWTPDKEQVREGSVIRIMIIQDFGTPKQRNKLNKQYHMLTVCGVITFRHILTCYVIGGLWFRHQLPSFFFYFSLSPLSLSPPSLSLPL